MTNSSRKQLNLDYKNEINKNTTNRESNKEIEEQIKENKINLDEKKEKYTELNNIKTNLERDNKYFESCKKEKDTMSGEILSAEKNINLYKSYQKIVSRNGIPYILLDKILQNIQQHANDFLSSIVDFKISLKQKLDEAKGDIIIDRVYELLDENRGDVNNDLKLQPNIQEELIDNNDIIVQTQDEIIENKGEYRIAAKNGSRFEKTIVSIALKIGIIQSTELTLTDFFMVDEAFVSFDTNYLQCIPIIYEKLRNIFNYVLLISHTPNLKSNCDKYIKVRMNKYSTLKQH